MKVNRPCSSALFFCTWQPRGPESGASTANRLAGGAARRLDNRRGSESKRAFSKVPRRGVLPVDWQIVKSCLRLAQERIVGWHRQNQQIAKILVAGCSKRSRGEASEKSTS